MLRTVVASLPIEPEFLRLLTCHPESSRPFYVAAVIGLDRLAGLCVTVDVADLAPYLFVESHERWMQRSAA